MCIILRGLLPTANSHTFCLCLILCNVFLILQAVDVAVTHRTELMKLFVIVVRNGFDYYYIIMFELIKCTIPSAWKVPVWSVLILYLVCIKRVKCLLIMHYLVIYAVVLLKTPSFKIVIANAVFCSRNWFMHLSANYLLIYFEWQFYFSF